MNRFLENLAVRLLNPAEAIQPRTPSRFEPEAAAAPRPFSAPETVWEEAAGPEQHELHSPETVRPEQDRPRRVLSRRAPIGPSTLPKDTAAALPTPAQAARSAFPSDALTPEPVSLPPDSVRDEAGANVPRPSASSASPVSPARQTVDVVPSVGAMPPHRPLTAADNSTAEMRAVPALAPRPALPAVRRLEGQAQEGASDEMDAPPGTSAPLSPAISPSPVRVPASAEAAVSPGGAIIAATVTAESGEDPARPETPGRPPIPLVARAAPVPSPPIAKPSEPTARETPPAPTIQVTIGRIEIRAAAPAPRVSNARPAPAKLTLEEYLRDGGRK